MPHVFKDGFHFADWGFIESKENDQKSAAEKYALVVDWSRKARGKNPNAFDDLTDWILDGAGWSDENLAENEKIFMGVIARFKDQNARLRAYLKALEPSGVVNAAAFTALDKFDGELSGDAHFDEMREAVAQMFADFSVMKNLSVRERIAGYRTGPAGTDTAGMFGYVNMLKDLDAGVQWTLFMPDSVEKQQKGFKVESFEYRKMPAMRFIGREGEDLADISVRKQLFNVLDDMGAYKSGLDYDVLFMHHYGLGVDVGEWHGLWGRFMKEGAPVPEGFAYCDFTPVYDEKAGPPYYSQFAYATFTGDKQAMHTNEGFDSDAMYDVTRNIMLGQGVNIPYPDNYWVAEVFREGCDKYSDAYMFSATL